jgi:hypothetical protein
LWSASMASLTRLQSAAGNSAVQRMIALQRCGPVPCDCSPEERAEKEGELGVQRTPDSGPLTVQRSLPFTSSIEIHHRVLKSRVFRVTEGGIRVTVNAGWHQSEEWKGPEPPECGSANTFQVQLSDDGTIFDSNFGGCTMPMGAPASRVWGNLPKGDYYLIISSANSNPNCYLGGDIEVTQESGITGAGCTVPPPGPWEILHTALDIAGLVPVLGAVPDGINAGMYAIEGDWINAGLSAVAMIPALGEGATVVKLGERTAVRMSGEAVERAGKEKIATALKDAKAAERKAAVEASDAALDRAKKLGIPGLKSCRVGSLYCPIDFLRQEFAALYQRRRSAAFAEYLRQTPDVDLNLGASLRREQTILTGDEMYRQFLTEVPRSDWSPAFREAVDSSRRAGVDYREIVAGGRRQRWPLDNVGSPWVVHHDPPLTWVSAESNQWWHPMPYHIHDAAHAWWRQLEQAVKSKVPPELRPRILDEVIDIRDL